MLFSTRIVTALLAAMPLAAALPPQPAGPFCATNAGEDALKVHAKLLAGDATVMEKVDIGKVSLLEASGFPGSSIEARQAGSAAPMNFRTYVHIIQRAAGNSVANGYVSVRTLGSSKSFLILVLTFRDSCANYSLSRLLRRSRFSTKSTPAPTSASPTSTPSTSSTAGGPTPCTPATPLSAR